MKAAGKKPSAYAAAGVDIDEMMTGLGAVKRLVNGTATAGVLSRLGSFGGLFRSPGRDTGFTQHSRRFRRRALE